MRLAFGLVGILGTLIAVVLFFSFAYLPYTQTVVQKGQSAQSQAEQIAGIDSQLGGRVSEHLAFVPLERGGRLAGLTVQGISPGSSYQTYYGIQAGDVIEQIGPQMVRDMDAEMAKALAHEAYQRKWDLVVQRGGRKYTLPADMNTAAAGSPAPTAAVPQPGQPTAAQPTSPQPGQQPGAQPAPKSANPELTPLQRQMDAILNFNSEDAGK